MTLRCIALHFPLAFGNVKRRRRNDPTTSRHEATRLEHRLEIRLVACCPRTLSRWAALTCQKIIHQSIQVRPEIVLKVAYLTSFVEVLGLNRIFLGRLKLTVAHNQFVNV
ncbi:hypothetical protein Rcae01_06205 [Novipirellula caenicola]|uniref:Uncharacterized protein n=1 Tax=Novipirellula caenicola TaxID=1536901 RepID=A0ABP9W2F2_9BACT